MVAFILRRTHIGGGGGGEGREREREGESSVLHSKASSLADKLSLTP